jgi:hypothetical protein
MDTLTERRAAAAAAEADRHKREDRLAQVALAVLRTDDGKELLVHLVKRFDLTGRTFMAGDKGESWREGFRAGMLEGIMLTITIPL